MVQLIVRVDEQSPNAIPAASGHICCRDLSPMTAGLVQISSAMLCSCISNAELLDPDRSGYIAGRVSKLQAAGMPQVSTAAAEWVA